MTESRLVQSKAPDCMLLQKKPSVIDPLRRALHNTVLIDECRYGTRGMALDTISQLVLE